MISLDPQEYDDWFIALGVLVLTFFFAAGSRAILRRIGHNGKWRFVRQLAPAISNLIYILGLAIFNELAPLPPKITKWLGDGIYVLGVILVLTLLRRAVLVTIEWSAFRSNPSRAMQLGFIPLLRNIITLFIFFAAAIMILKHFQYDVLSLLTALGVGSLAVGLAAKETIANMISGFTLIIDRNLHPGDRINLGGTTGDVEEIGLRSTRIRLGNGNVLIVPNSELVNTKIMNLSDPTRESSCTTSIHVPYTVPFNRVKALCLEALESVGKARKDKSRWVHLKSLADGHQLITVGFWLQDVEHSGEALTEFHERLLEKLQQERIALTTPPSLVGLKQ